jgi:hypothetical protein
VLGLTVYVVLQGYRETRYHEEERKEARERIRSRGFCRRWACGGAEGGPKGLAFLSFSLSSRSSAGRGGLDFGGVAVAGVDVVGKKIVCMTTLPCADIERGSNRGLRD